MVSPVVTALGIGRFGLQFSICFLGTVLLAHLVFGLLLGLFAKRFAGSEPSALLATLREGFVHAGMHQEIFGQRPPPNIRPEWTIGEIWRFLNPFPRASNPRMMNGL
jgi:hypothetical protein